MSHYFGIPAGAQLAGQPAAYAGQPSTAYIQRATFATPTQQMYAQTGGAPTLTQVPRPVTGYGLPAAPEVNYYSAAAPGGHQASYAYNPAAAATMLTINRPPSVAAPLAPQHLPMTYSYPLGHPQVATAQAPSPFVAAGHPPPAGHHYVTTSTGGPTFVPNFLPQAQMQQHQAQQPTLMTAVNPSIQQQLLQQQTAAAVAQQQTVQYPYQQASVAAAIQSQQHQQQLLQQQQQPQHQHYQQQEIVTMSTSYPTATAARYTPASSISPVVEPSQTSAAQYSGYEAALYSAATSYYQQQQKQKILDNASHKSSSGGGDTSLTSTSSNYQSGGRNRQHHLHSTSQAGTTGLDRISGADTYRRGRRSSGGGSHDATSTSDIRSGRYGNSGDSGSSNSNYRRNSSNFSNSRYNNSTAQRSSSGDRTPSTQISSYKENSKGHKYNRQEPTNKNFGSCSSSGSGHNTSVRINSHNSNSSLSTRHSSARHQHHTNQKSASSSFSTDPRLQQTSGAAATASTQGTTSNSSGRNRSLSGSLATVIGTGTSSTGNAATAIRKLMSTAPKINFIGGTNCTKTLSTVHNTQDSNSINGSSFDLTDDGSGCGHMNNIFNGGKPISLITPEMERGEQFSEEDHPPVGYEYIEETKNEAGKVVQFLCKLCDCKFNDPNAKELHVKGRRHRLQYKKKVDPRLEVDMKPSIRARRGQEDRSRRKQEDWQRYDMESRRREMQQLEWANYGGGIMGTGGGGEVIGWGVQGGRVVETGDDRHVRAKHWCITPTEIERQAVHRFVSTLERALKNASIKFPLKDFVNANPAVPSIVSGSSAPPSGSVFRGVEKAGVLAKSLLLHNDNILEMVLYCAIVPSVDLLSKLVEALPACLETTTPGGKFNVEGDPDNAAVLVTNLEEQPQLKASICLTSPLIRCTTSEDSKEQPVTQEAEAECQDESSVVGPAAAGEGQSQPPAINTDDGVEENVAPTTVSTPEDKTSASPPTLLDQEKGLEALASLRHVKWFQANAAKNESVMIVIRIFRDLCLRVPTWTPLNEWAMELLVVAAVTSAPDHPPPSPGLSLRRVFECVASGVLLSPCGVRDPCEREAVCVLAQMTGQEKEDITASAQHALRLIAFSDVHKVLDMEPLNADGQSTTPLVKKRKLSIVEDPLPAAVATESESTDVDGPSSEKKLKQDLPTSHNE